MAAGEPPAQPLACPTCPTPARIVPICRLPVVPIIIGWKGACPDFGTLLTYHAQVPRPLNSETEMELQAIAITLPT